MNDQHIAEKARLRGAIMHAFSQVKPMVEWTELEDSLLDHATAWLDNLYEDVVYGPANADIEEEREEVEKTPPVPVPPLEPVKVFDPGQDWRQS